MQWYVSITGDHNPETERIMLPVGVTLADVYKEYALAYPPNQRVGYSRFYSLWQTIMAHVSYQRVSITWHWAL